MLLKTNNDCYTIRTSRLFRINYGSGKSLRLANNIFSSNPVVCLFSTQLRISPRCFLENIFMVLILSEVFHFARIIFHVDKLLAMSARIIYTILELFCPHHPAVMAFDDNKDAPLYCFIFYKRSRASTRQFCESAITTWPQCLLDHQNLH